MKVYLPWKIRIYFIQVPGALMSQGHLKLWDHLCVENLGFQCLQGPACDNFLRLLFFSFSAKCQSNFPQILLGWQDGVNLLQVSYPGTVAFWGPVLIRGMLLLRLSILGGPWALPYIPAPQKAMKIQVAVL